MSNMSLEYGQLQCSCNVFLTIPVRHNFLSPKTYSNSYVGRQVHINEPGTAAVTAHFQTACTEVM